MTYYAVVETKCVETECVEHEAFEECYIAVINTSTPEKAIAEVRNVLLVAGPAWEISGSLTTVLTNKYGEKI